MLILRPARSGADPPALKLKSIEHAEYTHSHVAYHHTCLTRDSKLPSMNSFGIMYTSFQCTQARDILSQDIVFRITISSAPGKEWCSVSKTLCECIAIKACPSQPRPVPLHGDHGHLHQLDWRLAVL